MKEVGIAELRTTKTAKIFGAIGRSGLVSGCCARAAALPRPPLPGRVAGGRAQPRTAQDSTVRPRQRAHVSLRLSALAPESISCSLTRAAGPGLELDGSPPARSGGPAAGTARTGTAAEGA